MLLDGQTFDLVQHIDTVLAAVAGHELEPRINAELMQSVLEIATPVCHTPAEVAEQLRHIRGYVCGIARERGMRVGSAGTHPFSLFERQRITARDRYRALVDQMQYVARRELIFGMHIHVAVDDPDKAIQVVNGLLPHIGPLLALSASSPVLARRADRAPLEQADGLRGVPALGPAAALQELRRLRGGRRAAGEDRLIADYTHIWWDIRLHPRLGTIEVRICDAVTRLEHVVAIVAYCQALVKLFSERFDRGEEIPSYHRILTTENKWLAGRYGLEAPLMDLATGRRNRVAVAQLIRRTLKEIAAARARARLRARARGHRGDPAQRQRRRPAAPGLQREPRHRRGRERDRGRHGARGRAPAGEVGFAPDARSRRPSSAARPSGPHRNERRTLDELLADGPALFVFYLFDWSST